MATRRSRDDRTPRHRQRSRAPAGKGVEDQYATGVRCRGAAVARRWRLFGLPVRPVDDSVARLCRGFVRRPTTCGAQSLGRPWSERLIARTHMSTVGLARARGLALRRVRAAHLRSLNRIVPRHQRTEKSAATSEEKSTGEQEFAQGKTWIGPTRRRKWITRTEQGRSRKKVCRTHPDADPESSCIASVADVRIDVLTDQTMMPPP